MRYAHSEGHVDMCYDETGEYLLTCGSDGEVRQFEGFEDDDPVTHQLSDVLYAIACKHKRFYTACDNNAIRVHTMKDGQKDGFAARFTAPATHIVFNKSGIKMLAGASDFTVKLINIQDEVSSEQCMFEGHTAPILSVALHPQATFIASSSCDGTIRIWSVNPKKVVKTISGLPKTNDFGSTKTLCRLAWDKQGEYLAIPMDREVRVYENETWDLAFSLTDDSIKEMLSVVCFTPCGKYLAASSRDGLVVVWEFSTRKTVAVNWHEKKLTITALAWNPNGANELAFCDNHGNLGMMENLLPGNTKESDTPVVQEKGDGLVDDIFDDDGDDMLLEAGTGATLGDGDDGNSDDDDASIGRIKKRYSQMLEADDDDSRDPTVESRLGDGAATLPVPTVAPPVVVRPSFEPTPLQPPFQSSSSPVHLSHRFMVWNAVGVIIQYNTEEENSINVEFHDTATHHALHVVNTLGHTMADMSSDAVLLACPSDIDNSSTLVCMNLGSQDSHQEWTTSMPHGEDIRTICIGDGWVAVATDKRQVRIFTVGGVQKEVFSLPGPAVTMAAFGSQLMVVYHSGLGIPGDQCLAMHLLQITSRRKALIHGSQLPISPKSTLSWLGFSAEGTPFSVDSLGVVRMLNRAFCDSWTQVANTKTQCKGKSDNYWVIGMMENPQQLRVILCKGSRFPPTLPRPTTVLLPFQLPLCELNTDKGSLEVWQPFCILLMRTIGVSLFSNHLDWWSSEGYQCDDSAKMQAMIPCQEALMKLFALACKSQRESRAVELCRMMPTQHTIQLAIKYASRLHLMPLAQRLNEVARSKAEEEDVARQREEETEDFRDSLDNGYSHTVTEWGKTEMHASPAARDRGEQADGMEVDVNGNDEDGQKRTSGPMLTFKSKKPTNETPKSILNSQEGRKNPFKLASQKAVTPARGSSVFDSIEKVKSGSRLIPAGKSSKERPEPRKRDKTQQQGTLFGINKKAPKEKKVSAFQAWSEENKDSLREEHPDLSEADLTALAARTYKGLTSEEKQEWIGKAAASTTEDETKKRKRDETTEPKTIPETKAVKTVNDNGDAGGKTKLKTAAKLSSFSFAKN